MTEESGAPASGPSKHKVLNLDLLMGPKATAQTSIGTVYLYSLRASDISEFRKLRADDPAERVREFLPCIASLSERSSFKEEREPLPTELAAQLTEADLDALGTAYASPTVLGAAREYHQCSLSERVGTTWKSACKPAQHLKYSVIRTVFNQITLWVRARLELGDSYSGAFAIFLNPPFGHLGESAVKEWFAEFEKQIPISDLVAFDGNPQGFRLMSFLGGADSFGFNLTCTLLLSTVKYPWNFDRKPEGKKIGVFSTDFSNYQLACENLGWGLGKKFPFMRLMDTADEIAYSMSDLEDGLEKRIITDDDLKRIFGESSFPHGVLKPFIAFKTKVINQAVTAAADTFTKHLDAILAGEDLELIDPRSEIGELLGKVSQFARDRIYSADAAEQVELAGRSVIKGLLNHFGELIKLPEEDFADLVRNDGKAIKKKELDFEVRLYRRLPKSYCEKYSAELRGSELQRRAHLIVDFISGMTDDFALETYQILEGIRIK